MSPVQSNLLLINAMKCPFCKAQGQATASRRRGQRADIFEYDCALGHAFERLADGEYRLQSETPERIERNNGGLY